MKTRAKIAITLLIAMMMVISMFPLGTQAAVGTGEGPEDGKLTIHKYLMPDVSTATVEGDGTLAEPGDIPTGANPINGVIFDLYKVILEEPDDDEGSGTWDGATFIYHGEYPEEGYYVVNTTTTIMTDSTGQRFRLEAADIYGETDSFVTTAGGTPAAPAGIAEAILPRGIYLVVEHADARIASPAAPFVVSIPMAHPGQEDDPDTIGVDETIEQGTPNYNVHVYPKNESIQIDKSVGAEDDMGEMIEGETGFEEIRTDHRSYNLEEDFPWFIDVSVPTEIYIPYGDSNGNFAEDAGETFDEALQDQDGNIKFKITDVLESELTFIEPVLPNVLTDVVKLYSIDAINALEHDDSKALGAAHYLVTFNAATNTLDVELTPAGRYYIYNENNDGDGDFIKFLRVVFQTEINATAPMHTPIYNNATLDFTNRFGGRWDPYANGGAGAFVPITVEVDADKRPEVHTGQLQIIKTNDETGTALEYIAGAKFKIATSEANAKAGVFIGDDDGDFEAETAAEPVNPGDLPKGYAVIKGLAYGQAGDLADEDSLPTEYWLVETKAPAGYNLLLDPIKVTVAKGPAPDYKIIPVDAAGGTGVVGNADDPDPVTGIGDGKLDDNDYLLSVTVVNSDEFTLPLTGGMGTLLFTVGGIVLIGLAIILFVATKKKKKAAK